MKKMKKKTIDDSIQMQQLNENIEKSLKWLDLMGPEMKALMLEFIKLKNKVDNDRTKLKHKLEAAHRIQEILARMEEIKAEKGFSPEEQ